MSQHQGGTTGLSDDIGHRERLACAGRTQKGLITTTTIHTLHQLSDRRRLITFGGVGRSQVVGRHGPRAVNPEWGTHVTGPIGARVSAAIRPGW